jgi:hypothetical protein
MRFIYHISPFAQFGQFKLENKKMLLYQYYILLFYNLDYTAAITTTEW